MPLDTKEFIDAICGKGDRAHDWKDKPHRLIYDLVNEIERLRSKEKRTTLYLYEYADLSRPLFYLALKEVYYREGSNDLHEDGPTWFKSKSDAIMSVVLGGNVFKVEEP